MKLGLYIQHSGLAYAEILELAKLAEDLGYHSVSMCDRMNSSGHPSERILDTWSLLPSLAVNTTRIKLLPLVTNNLFRHPGVLAKMASSVDMISKGRLIFGIGAGLDKQEVNDSGSASPTTSTRMRMLEESIQVILKLWTEPTSTSFSGEFYKLENAESLPKPFQKPHPPILVGGKGERRLLLIAARFADVTNFTLQDLPLEECKRLLGVLKVHCRNVGRDYSSIRKTISGLCFVSRGESELRDEVRSEASRRGMTEDEFRQYLGTSALFGTVDQVISKFKQFESLGIEEAVVSFPRNVQADKAKLVAEALMPKLAN